MTTRGDQARPGATRDEFARETGRRHAFTTRRSLPPAPHLGGLSRVQELIASLGNFFGAFVQQVQKHLNSVGRNINEEGLYRLPGYHDIQGRPIGLWDGSAQKMLLADRVLRSSGSADAQVAVYDGSTLVPGPLLITQTGSVNVSTIDGNLVIDLSHDNRRNLQVKTASVAASIYVEANSGEVGINTVLPKQALDVNGNIAVSGNLDAGGAVKLDTFLNLGAQTALTISGGVITATATFLQIDTEGAAASDDLDTINGGTEGDLVILKIANNTRAVVVKHGTGNIHLHGSADFTLDHRRDSLLLIHRNSLWETLAPGANNA